MATYLMRLHPDIYQQEQERVSQHFEEAVRLAEQACIAEFAKLVCHDGERRIFRDTVVNLSSLGPLTITRASHVEPGAAGRWWADLSQVGGPMLGPFGRRSEALDAERVWPEAKWLSLSPYSW